MASSDAGELLAALGHRIDMATIEQVSPWRFAAPLSPDMAARRENRSVPFDGLVSFCRSQIAAAPDTLLIEGVGGVMVPLDERHTVLDWLAALEIPALLVVGSYLGAISHTLTALSVLRARAIPVSMIIINETQGSTVALEEGAATVRRFTGATEVVTMRRNPDSGDFAAIASRL
jgi:dethiobiotin synthetase